MGVTKCTFEVSIEEWCVRSRLALVLGMPGYACVGTHESWAMTCMIINQVVLTRAG